MPVNMYRSQTLISFDLRQPVRKAKRPTAVELIFRRRKASPAAASVAGKPVGAEAWAEPRAAHHDERKRSNPHEFQRLIIRRTPSAGDWL